MTPTAILSPATIARLVTMNKGLLSQLTTEEVMYFHPLILTDTLTFGRCQKTKPIYAKPVSSILNDASLVSHLLLATLEANEGVKGDGFVCRGEAGDVWMQTGPKLHGKYTPTKVCEDGWTLFEPKPEKPFDCFQVTEIMKVGPERGWSCINATTAQGKDGWGDERVVGREKVHFQYGVVGDWILRNPEDLLDCYRVGQKFFANTYALLT